jgi:hypothetical protein
LELLILRSPAQFFEVPTLTLKFLIVAINLLILLGCLILATLELVADQRARAQAQGRSDGSARRRMTYCRTNETARCRATQSADSSAFLTGG